ncbi:hypothetical protein T06_2796 [Trichinella sp. T6]|nr:hypothetical protein T06_2796 [Trichinella sp. T6]
MPSIAHASYTSLAYQRMIQLHEHRQFKGDSSLMDTQPLYVLMGSILIAGKGNIVVVLSLSSCFSCIRKRQTFRTIGLQVHKKRGGAGRKRLHIVEGCTRCRLCIVGMDSSIAKIYKVVL